jgi:hypothetical protein
VWRAVGFFLSRTDTLRRWRLRAEQDQVLLRTCLTAPA